MPTTRSQKRQLLSQTVKDSNSASPPDEGNVEPMEKRTKQDRESDKDGSRLLHVIPPHENECGKILYQKVLGLTILADELFVHRDLDRRCLQVYDVTSFTYKHSIQLHEETTGMDSPHNLTSCDVNQCLYLSVTHGKAVLRIDLTRGKKFVEQWKVDDYPDDLSVTAKNNVLVACSKWLHAPYHLIEYTTHGLEVRKIALDCNIGGLWHAVELTDDQFLISYMDWGSKSTTINHVHSLCVVDADGQVRLSFKNTRSTYIRKPLRHPLQFVVDKSGKIYVAFSSYRGVVVLDSALERSCDLEGGEIVNQPRCLFFDKRRSQLFVGECDKKSRILVFSI